ncbi:hypothetical protein JTE90_020337 [Oedothorax gibbosus]|uniref:Uncharacterized protein n=1 Tax=Oedothorax gibbosus TaxID=931172 RepID=A0AAV6VMQ3_9ARAC|nr:hypothetical protein JTE90_020337 [Oedothorax gibbosus]
MDIPATVPIDIPATEQMDMPATVQMDIPATVPTSGFPTGPYISLAERVRLEELNNPPPARSESCHPLRMK